FFMQGAARALFVPLALAVGFAMITSYLLSSTFVPVLSVWLLRHHPSPPDPLSPRGERGSQNLPPRPSLGEGGRGAEGLRDRSAGVVAGVVRWRWLLLPGYLVVAGVLVGWWLLGHPALGTEIFPVVDTGQFQLRLRAPAGTPLERTEELARDVLKAIGDKV